MFIKNRRRALASLLGAALTAATIAVTPTPAFAVGSGGARFVMADFGFDQGWRVDRHPRLLADITGDGRADIVGFGNDGVHTATSRGDGTYNGSRLVLGEFGYNQGWRVGQHPRFVADVTGDGRADIVGVGSSTVLVAVSLGNGTFAAPQAVNIGFVAGSTYFLADVNADNRADLYRVTNGQVDIALALGNGSFATPILATTEFSSFPFQYDTPKVVDVTGDHRAEFLAISVSGPIHIVSTSPRLDNTYPLSHRSQPGQSGPSVGVEVVMDRFADVTGDGRADIVAFGQTGPTSYTAVSVGGGNFNDFIPAVNDFGAGAGWGSNQPLDVVDINGDHRADIVGFGFDGVLIGLSNGNGTFSLPQLLVGDFGSNQSWRVDRHVRAVADITGDGRADIVGFGDAGVYTAVTTP